ncbi:MAG TPA: hypothetical protein ENG99_01325 [bacterium]|nr:hypothetical protein [bacterium]
MENFCKKGKLENKNGYDVCRAVDWRGSLRYDFTLLYAKDSAGELPRTFGHYHTKGFAELFGVIKGETMALMQKHGREPNAIEEVYLIEAATGENLVILPNFGFTNINPDASQDLLLSNWIDNNVENQYGFIKKYDGFCYRAIRDSGGNIIFEKNKEYKKIPKLVKIKPRVIPKELRNMDFLNNPDKYSELLTIKNLYEKN